MLHQNDDIKLEVSYQCAFSNIHKIRRVTTDLHVDYLTGPTNVVLVYDKGLYK